MARPRTPTALKLVKGTAQPCRTNRKEPKPRREIPSPPAHLSDRAKTAWGAVALILDRMGIVTEADGVALEGLCEAYADLVDARVRLRERGSPTYKTISQTGSVMFRAYPEVAMVSDADRRLGFWLGRVGMTPADRSKVSAIDDKKDADPWADL